jgi:hypothetical protein
MNLKMETLQKLQSLHIGQGQGAMHARSISDCHEKKKKKSAKKVNKIKFLLYGEETEKILQKLFCFLPGICLPAACLFVACLPFACLPIGLLPTCIVCVPTGTISSSCLPSMHSACLPNDYSV